MIIARAPISVGSSIFVFDIQSHRRFFLRKIKVIIHFAAHKKVRFESAHVCIHRHQIVIIPIFWHCAIPMHPRHCLLKILVIEIEHYVAIFHLIVKQIRNLGDIAKREQFLHDHRRHGFQNGFAILSVQGWIHDVGLFHNFFQFSGSVLAVKLTALTRHCDWSSQSKQIIKNL